MSSLERHLKTSSGNIIQIKSNNQTIVNHFNESKSYADFIINQINIENIYEKYLIGSNLVIFDIGANIGLFSLHCSDRASMIYSFEPTPHHYEILKELTQDYHNIKPINIAISDTNSYIPFYLSDDNTTMNSIVNKYNKQITVKGQSILTFVLENNIDKVDFIKCDVEDAEKLVMDGGFKMIENRKPIILFELLRKWSAKFGYCPNDILFKLQEIGYECYEMKEGLIKIKEINDETESTNFLFINTKNNFLL